MRLLNKKMLIKWKKMYRIAIRAMIVNPTANTKSCQRIKFTISVYQYLSHLVLRSRHNLMRLSQYH